MTRVRTVVPRYKKDSGKRADIMTFNIQKMRTAPSGEQEVYIDSVTVTPQGVEASEDDANFMLSTSQRIELVDVVDYSRMNKDALLAELVRKNITIPSGRPTNAQLIALLEAPLVDPDDESEAGVVVVGDPPEGGEGGEGTGDPPGTDD